MKSRKEKIDEILGKSDNLSLSPFYDKKFGQLLKKD